jgi:hypothetical protein
MPKPIEPRNKALWQRVLPEIVTWLQANPLASCTDAGRKFDIHQGTLNQQLATSYPGQFDWNERRRLRGERSRKPKRQKVDTTAVYAEMHKVTELFGEVINALARIEAVLDGKRE